MDDKLKLIIIKLAHSLVWLIMASASFYILYAGIFRIKSMLLWVSIGLLCFETLILLMNKWTCPLTPMAMKYTKERGDNFDIYLPRLLARYNKIIFGFVFILGLVLVFLNK